MGQYFHPVDLETNNYFNAHDMGGGIKLMETAWRTNWMLRSVEQELKKGGKWYKSRIVWAGDYADENKHGKNISGSLVEAGKLKIDEKIEEDVKYIVNDTLGEYVNMDEIKPNEKGENGDDWTIHPLPILTAESNGRGGGDFVPDGKLDDIRIGRWMYHRIFATNEKKDIKGYNKINGKFYEGRGTDNNNNRNDKEVLDFWNKLII